MKVKYILTLTCCALIAQFHPFCKKLVAQTEFATNTQVEQSLVTTNIEAKQSPNTKLNTSNPTKGSLLGFSIAKNSSFLQEMTIIDSLLHRYKDRSQALYLKKAKILLNYGFYQEASIIATIEHKEYFKVKESLLFHLIELAACTLRGEPSSNVQQYLLPRTEDIRLRTLAGDEYFFWKSIHEFKTLRSKKFLSEDDLLRFKFLISRSNTNFLRSYAPILYKKTLFHILKFFSKKDFLLEIANIAFAKLSQRPDLSSEERDDLNYYDIFLNHQNKRNIEASALLQRYLESSKYSTISLENNIRARLLNIQINNDNIEDSEKAATLSKIALLGFNWPYETQALSILATLYAKHQMPLEAIRSLDNIQQTLRYDLATQILNRIYSEISKLFAAPQRYEWQILSFYAEDFQYINDVDKFPSYIVTIARILNKHEMYHALINLLPQVINRGLPSEDNEMMINILIGAYLETNAPQQAIALIRNSIPYDRLYGNLARKRYALQAQALFAIQQYHSLYKLLSSNFSIQSDSLISKSYFAVGDWKAFNQYSEPYLYYLKRQKSALSIDDLFKIMRQEISYTSQNSLFAFDMLYNCFKDRAIQKGEQERILRNMLDNTQQFIRSPGQYGFDGLQDVKKLSILKEKIVKEIKEINKLPM